MNEESVEENVIYFPLHPRFALFYMNTIPHKSRNRIVLISNEDINFCNNQYFEMGAEQVRFVFSKKKKILEQLIK